MEEKNPLSLVVGVAYIECATPHLLCYKVEYQCHNTWPLQNRYADYWSSHIRMSYPAEWNELVEWSAVLRVVVAARVTFKLRYIWTAIWPRGPVQSIRCPWVGPLGQACYPTPNTCPRH